MDCQCILVFLKGLTNEPCNVWITSVLGTIVEMTVSRKEVTHAHKSKRLITMNDLLKSLGSNLGSHLFIV